MSGRDIVLIFPSRANLVLMKRRIASATAGLRLLKRKRDALELHMRRIEKKLIALRTQIEAVMLEATFSIAKAKFLGSDFRRVPVEQHNKADAFMRTMSQKIIGMNVATMELVLKPVTSLPLAGLAGGGQQVEIVRTKFQEALKLLVTIGSLELNLGVVKQAVEITNRRANGLEYVVVPRYQRTLSYINEELEEYDREDFYRLKRSQATQRRKKSEFIAQMEQRPGDPEAHPGLDFAVSEFKYMSISAPIGLPKTLDSKNVRPRTMPHVKGNKVVLLPEEQVKPVLIGRKERMAPTQKPEKESIQPVVTSSSSESTDASESEEEQY